MIDKTMTFSVEEGKKEAIHCVLFSVYKSLQEKGYNPINQLVGYILSEDPTYITAYKNARSMICKIERDDILKELVKSYLKME